MSGCTCDYSKCRKDCACRCHEHVEKAMEQYYELGQIVGIEGVEERLRDLAGDHFKNGRDEAAATYRGLADYFRQSAEERRKKYHAGKNED